MTKIVSCYCSSSWLFREVADVLLGLGIDVSEAPATEAPALYDPLTTPASEGPTPGEFH